MRSEAVVTSLEQDLERAVVCTGVTSVLADLAL